jgi:tetratricopeptide (TPR) repeat protein
LRGLETSGFDISNFFGDMITSIDAAREARRPAESAEAVKRHREARERARRESADRMAREAATTVASSEGRQALVKGLTEADELLRLGDYAKAEEQLRALQKQYPTEPHVYFALARVASRSAEGAFDPALQTQRLSLALQLYQDAIRAASPDTDAALISRAHVASGRILAHLERSADALKEFDAAIRLGAVEGGALREAQAERQKLNPQP